MNRRTFLKIAGLGSVSAAAGCSSEPEKSLYALVQAPDDMVTGKPNWYASTCRECPAGCGILAKNREGRVIKLEGNPHHPVNNGKLCMRGQAALQDIYHPDRIKTPLIKEKNGWRDITFAQARQLLKEKAETAARKGSNRVRMLTEVVGDSLLSLFTESLAKWNSAPPLLFEPFAYESLKAANRNIFGVDGLVSYRMHQADFLLSFGADFLETWLSPVEYADKFKRMHTLKDGKKNPFYHISPYQSLTGANADICLHCTPGSEAALVLSIANELMMRGKGVRLPQNLRKSIRRVALPYTKEIAVPLAGISPEQYLQLLNRLMQAYRPLVLGTGTGSTGKNSLQTHMAVNLLNLILDPTLPLFDFNTRHRVEIAAGRSALLNFFAALNNREVDLLLLNNVNPVFSTAQNSGMGDIFEKESIFVVSFSSFMDETTEQADMVLPVSLPLETWGEYSGKNGVVSTLQPAMGKLTEAPHLGDVFLRAAGRGNEDADAAAYKAYLYAALAEKKLVNNLNDWISALRVGGLFGPPSWGEDVEPKIKAPIVNDFKDLSPLSTDELAFIAAPSIRFFDGRGANKPWLCEIPDALTQVAWQSPVRMHPQSARRYGLKQEDSIRIQSRWGILEAAVYETDSVKPGVLVMEIGQGHKNYGRYARNAGQNPFQILPPHADPASGGPILTVSGITIQKTGRTLKLAHLDGSRFQHGRRIARRINLKALSSATPPQKPGLTMDDFPLTLPIPEGYGRKRDIYPAHDHDTYRWSMVVDLDRCIGCGACTVACYAENNIGIVGLEQTLAGREMSWIRVERYLDPAQPQAVTFLPMLCQHCDNAPCESVCPVYAPHHSKEGLNNQIYNRCIGTRFCSQNCPYKVRRFNWFAWDRPRPSHLQLNPDVTTRSKGVMEKCSFCIQRIKYAHGIAKNENRKIRDGEVQPACLQSCPTRALSFGNLMDRNSRVRKLVSDPRAYQILGYLNTKPAVIYLTKVIADI